MGPDDIFNGMHIGFFILFVRTRFPGIGGTSPHVAFRFELSCERLTPGGNFFGAAMRNAFAYPLGITS